MLLLSLIMSSCNYSGSTISHIPTIDTCLRHAIYVAAESNSLKILEINNRDADTSQVVSSLRKIYKDTIIKRLEGHQEINVIIANLGTFKFSEYQLTDNYYRFLKSTDSLWSVSKVEGFFYFKADTGKISKPNTYILKGPPVILICYCMDSSKYNEQKLFMLMVVKHINNCRGTDKW